MIKTVKRYILNDDVTKEKIEAFGFREGGFIKSLPRPKYFFNGHLHGDIEIHIEIVENTDGTFFFDDYYCVYVIDDEFCQPYYPFYAAGKDLDDNIDPCNTYYAEGKHLNFLNTVITRYNELMDALVEKGILQEKPLEKTKVLTNK